VHAPPYTDADCIADPKAANCIADPNADSAADQHRIADHISNKAGLRRAPV
jgi:hypothetical protein